MIGTIPVALHPSAVEPSNAGKEASLQSQIDATDAKANTCGCTDTAAKLKKDVAKLKAQLDALKATDKASGDANKKPDKLAGPEATARQSEFDNDNDDQSGRLSKVMWA